MRRQAPTKEALNRSANSALESLQTLLMRIAGEELTPVLIFDDTDRWLSFPGAERRDVASVFFSKVLPALQRLSAGMVVAAQPRYFDEPDLREQLDRFLSDRVDIPRLPSAEALAKVLASRIDHHVGDRRLLQNAIAEEAIERLYDLYTTEFNGSLRRVIGTVHVALRDALESGHRRIGREVVEQAAV